MCHEVAFWTAQGGRHHPGGCANVSGKYSTISEHLGVHAALRGVVDAPCMFDRAGVGLAVHYSGLPCCQDEPGIPTPCGYDRGLQYLEMPLTLHVSL